jgi:phage tail sheath protein FI
MPTPLSYPGVYIEEVPGGVRTITGVATSITAFAGGTAMGPANEPTLCNSFAEFERRFGGLRADLPLGYAVRDFYLNGGTQALIARAVGANARTATITLEGEAGGSPAGAIVLEAASEGEWGNRIRVAVQNAEAEDATSPPTGLFNLIVEYTTKPGGEEVVRERILNLSVDENAPRFVTRVLAGESSFVRVQSVSGLPRETFQVGSPPATDWAQGEGGEDDTVWTPTDVIEAVESLQKADIFNLLCIPPPVRGGSTHPTVWQAALNLCAARRAMLIVDPAPEWGVPAENVVADTRAGVQALGLPSPLTRNAAIYVPCVQQSDPLRDGQIDTFVPCGIVAGVMARTDATRGVWKAPAGLDAGLNGVQGLQVNLTDLENGELNQRGINCLRSFPVHGRVVWGARTLRGSDQAADEYKYVPVRRLALFIEESLFRGTQWVVFEPNDEPLWAQIRLNVGAFMQNLFRQGAFQGRSPREAYLVKCDAETTTQNDINLGIVNILVGFAPLKPAEFVVIRIQQLAGQVQA